MDSSRSSLLDDDYVNYPVHTRLPNEQVLELYAELTLQGEYHLLPYEEDWKARRPFLESKGYELRPRYTEDWWPSWIGTDINPFFCEDSIDSCVRILFCLFVFVSFHFHYISLYAERENERARSVPFRANPFPFLLRSGFRQVPKVQAASLDARPHARLHVVARFPRSALRGIA